MLAAKLHPVATLSVGHLILIFPTPEPTTRMRQGGTTKGNMQSWGPARVLRPLAYTSQLV
jgi:hypothetical protein